MAALHLNGNDLTLESLSRWCCTASPFYWKPMRGERGAAREWWMRWVAGDRVAYAITTGVGIWPMCESRRPGA